MLRKVLLKCEFEERIDHLLLCFSCLFVKVFLGLVEDKVNVLDCCTFMWLFVDVSLTQSLLELFGPLVDIVQHFHAS